MKKVLWSKRAKDSLENYCKYIATDSPVSAEKVRKEIILAARSLAENPEIFQLDEYYPNNPGNIRRFIKWSYRVVYQVRNDSVLIVNIFHTSKHPLSKD